MRTTTGRPGALLPFLMLTGWLTTIVTAGVLVGLGRRDGEATRLFRLAGRALLESAGIDAATLPLTSVVVGGVHHVVVSLAWGGLLAVPLHLLGRGRPVRGMGTALAAAAVHALLAITVLPAPMCLGFAVTRDVPGAVAIAGGIVVAMIGALWVDAGRR